jgi:peroxiredoxin
MKAPASPRSHPRPRGAPALLAGAAALLLVGPVACGGEAGEERASRPAPPIPGNPAPAWEARTLAGEPVSLEALRGEVVILNVWATWCTPCLREMPGLEALGRHFEADGLRIIGASVDRSSAEPDVQRFARELGLTFTIALDPDQQVMNRFRTLGVPETFLIDREGIIAHRWIGEFDPMDPSVLERVQNLLDAGVEAGS